jgi:hypothetical protein
MDWRMNGWLTLLRMAARSETLDRLHAAVEQEIAAASQRVDQAHDGSDEYVDAVTDDECDRIEDLLGLAFVACQSYMTGLRTRVAALSQVCQSKYGATLPFASDSKAYGVFKVGHATGSNHTDAEVANAVANYWKHQDDWPTREEKRGGKIATVWDVGPMRSNEKRTVEIVTSIGISFGSTGNLRDGAKALGVTDYADLSPIRKKLRTWAGKVSDETRRALLHFEGHSITEST